MRAEAPERILVGAQLAEIEAVRVDVADLAELAARDDVGEPAHPRVVLEQVSDHQDAAVALSRRDRRLCVTHRLREGLLDEAVLASVQHANRELSMRRHRRREHHTVELGVGEQLVERIGEAG